MRFSLSTPSSVSRKPKISLEGRIMLSLLVRYEAGSNGRFTGDGGVLGLGSSTTKSLGNGTRDVFLIMAVVIVDVAVFVFSVENGEKSALVRRPEVDDCKSQVLTN